MGFEIVSNKFRVKIPEKSPIEEWIQCVKKAKINKLKLYSTGLCPSDNMHCVRQSDPILSHLEITSP